MSTTDETLVREALQHATDDLAAPVHRLTERATVGGRRLRRRRRIVAGIGTLCAVTVIATPVVASLGDRDGRAGDVASDPSSLLPEPQPIVDEPGWWEMPATEMLVHVKVSTPDGLSFADPILTNEGENAPGEPVGVLRGWMAADVVAHGVTAGGINVLLYPPRAVTHDMWTCPGNLTLPATCVEVTDESGAVVGRTSAITTGPVTVREVVLKQADGGMVYVAASNSADDKWGRESTPASDEVPLTMAQLRAIASDPAWVAYEPPTEPQGPS